jgi:hypothetical protein
MAVLIKEHTIKQLLAIGVIKLVTTSYLAFELLFAICDGLSRQVFS